MSDTVHQRLLRGEIVQVGSKLYALCSDCRSVVHINKFLLGAMHLCLTEEEREFQRKSALGVSEPDSKP